MTSESLKALVFFFLAFYQVSADQLLYISNSSYVGQYNQPDFIEGVLDTVNQRRNDLNLPPIMWDENSATCSYVTACIRARYRMKTPHGVNFGMKSCNSYTCGGVTCNYHAMAEGASQLDTSVVNGYQDALKDLIEEKDENGVVGAGGHARPFRTANTTLIGCGTYIADAVQKNNANIYCQYSRRTICSDLECCSNEYWREKNKECKAAVQMGRKYFQGATQYCESYPNADHTLVSRADKPRLGENTGSKPVSSASVSPESVKPSSTTVNHFCRYRFTR